MFHEAAQDVIRAARSNPAIAAVAILSLALGIGANMPITILLAFALASALALAGDGARDLSFPGVAVEADLFNHALDYTAPIIEVLEQVPGAGEFPRKCSYGSLRR